MKAMKLNINHEVLKWARESLNISKSDVITKLNKKTIKEDNLDNWENGSELIDINTAKKLAKLYGISLAVLYMPHIPKNIQPEIRDLRQIKGAFSKNSILLMRKLVGHYEWVREYLINENKIELDFVGMVSINDSIEHPLSIFKNMLEIKINFSEDSEYNFKKIVNELEKNNIFKTTRSISSLSAYTLGTSAVTNELTVCPFFFISIANSYNCNHHYKVPVEEIRGFAIADKIAPFIFINSSDSNNAKLFTLIHELTHILLGETGISNLYFNYKVIQNNIESYCNKVASEFLMPSQIFRNLWANNNKNNLEDKIEYISIKLPVSKLAVLVKAKTLNYINDNIIFDNLFNKFSKIKYNNSYKKNGFPNPNLLIKNLNTKMFSNYVLKAYNNNNITLKDVCNLLSIKPYRFQKYIEKV